MGAWVTGSPNPWTRRAVPLDYRFHVAAAGVLGIGVDLAACDEAELSRLSELVELYKSVRHIVQHGVQHRLVESDAVQYSARDGSEIVVLAFLDSRRFGRATAPVPLRALEPQAVYREAGTRREHHGAVLLSRGLPLDLPAGEHASALIHLRRVGHQQYPPIGETAQP
jgi:alpha-galactosidase